MYGKMAPKSGSFHVDGFGSCGGGDDDGVGTAEGVALLFLSSTLDDTAGAGVATALMLILWSGGAVAPDATELTLSLNLEALFVTKLPIVLLHPENPADARAPALLSLDVIFVEVADATDATDTKLSGRSFRSPVPAPVPVAAITDGENEDGGGGGE